jgi:hypothetical protein
MTLLIFWKGVRDAIRPVAPLREHGKEGGKAELRKYVE